MGGIKMVSKGYSSLYNYNQTIVVTDMNFQRHFIRIQNLSKWTLHEHDCHVEFYLNTLVVATRINALQKKFSRTYQLKNGHYKSITTIFIGFNRHINCHKQLPLEQMYFSDRFVCFTCNINLHYKSKLTALDWIYQAF